MAVITQEWLDKNTIEPSTSGARFIKYLGTPIGTFRFLQVIEKILGLGNKIGADAGLPPCPRARELQGNIGFGTAVLGIAGLPSDTVEAVKSVVAFKDQTDGIPLSRKVAKAVSSVMEAVSNYASTLWFITKNSTARIVADVTDFTGTVADAQMAASNYREAGKGEIQATGQIKRAFAHSKRYYLLSLMKSVSSLAMAIFGWAVLVVGAALISPIALIAISLSLTLLGIKKDLHKNSGEHKIIEFDKSAYV